MFSPGKSITSIRARSIQLELHLQLALGATYCGLPYPKLISMIKRSLSRKKRDKTQDRQKKSKTFSHPPDGELLSWSAQEAATPSTHRAGA